MKLWQCILGAILLGACETHAPAEKQRVETNGFDSVLAAKWGADEYGMKTYYWIDLVAGPNRSHSAAETDSIQRGHMNHINAMAEQGYLVLAGPFLDSNAVKGIFILNVADRAMADSLVAQDPAVQSGRLIMKIRPWYGSAAVMGINDAHQKVAKVNI